MLFPGAKITTAGEYTQCATWAHKVIEIPGPIACA